MRMDTVKMYSRDGLNIIVNESGVKNFERLGYSLTPYDPAAENEAKEKAEAEKNTNEAEHKAESGRKAQEEVEAKTAKKAAKEKAE